MYLTVKKFNNGKPILFGLSRMATPYSVVVKNTDVLPDFSLNRTVPEGSFMVRAGNGVRFLPRTKVKGAYGASNVNGTSTSSANLTLKFPSMSFKVGDVLYPKACFAELLFSGTFTAGDIYTVRINDASYTVTAPASPTANSVAAAFITANDTALKTAGVTATQRGTTGSVYLYANNSYSIYTSSSSGGAFVTVNTTESGYFGDNIQPLGTIQSIGNAAENGERVITLAANASYVVPANVSLGIEVEKHLGIYYDPLDLTDEPVKHIAPIVECDGVYEQNLPYVDEQLKRIHSALYINKRFYEVV